MANQTLVERIKVVHADSDETYGSPRVCRDIRAQGVVCGENRVARLMRLHHLQAKQSRRYRATTRRSPTHPVAPNLLKRDFKADRSGHKWLADITYIPTLMGWLYLAVVMDLYTRRIVGWAMSDRMTDPLVLDALDMALRQHPPSPGLIHHSDQGSQYTGRAYQELLKSHAIQVSMNGVGSWYDNAPMESFFGSLKSERVHHTVYHTHDEARSDLFYYIEAFYNRRRIHSALNYLSPEAFEHLYYHHCEWGFSPCPQN